MLKYVHTAVSPYLVARDLSNTKYGLAVCNISCRSGTVMSVLCNASYSTQTKPADPLQSMMIELPERLSSKTTTQKQ